MVGIQKRSSHSAYPSHVPPKSEIQSSDGRVMKVTPHGDAAPKLIALACIVTTLVVLAVITLAVGIPLWAVSSSQGMLIAGKIFTYIGIGCAVGVLKFTLISSSIFSLAKH